MTKTITASDFKKDPALKTVTQTQDPILTSGQGIINDSINGIKSNQNELAKFQQEQAQRVKDLAKNQSSLGGKAQFTANQREITGANQARNNFDRFSQQLNDINANVSGLANEAKTIPLTVQENNANTGATDRGVAPQTAGLLRRNAIKALTQASLADIVTANVNNSVIKYNSAIDKATEAVNIKYQPIENEIANLKEQLQLNKDFIITPKEKKIAEQQLKILNERERITAKNKADENAVNAIRLEIAKSDPSKVGILDKVTSVKDAISKAGEFLKTSQNQIVKLDNGTTLLVDKVTGKTIKNFGGGTSSGSGTSTPTTIIRTVNTNNGAQAVDGYTLQAGDTGAVIAKQNGISFEELAKLNPDIKDWNNLQVGGVLNVPNNSENWLRGKTNEQVSAYNSLADEDKASVKQLITGDALVTDIVKSRGLKGTTQIKKLISDATLIDPTFSVNRNKIRFNANKKWADPAGKPFLTRSAMNTALAHMGTTYEASKALKNVRIPAWNKLTNFYSKNVGKPELTSFVLDLTLLAGEIASAYKNGTAPSESDREAVFATMTGNLSPAQFKGIFSESAKLMSGKLKSVAQEYKQSVGKFPTDPIIQLSVLNELNSAGIDTSSINKLLKEQGYEVNSNPIPKKDTFLQKFTPKAIESSISNVDFFNQF